MSNLLTNSRRSTFRACRRLHQLEYLEGFRPVRQAEYFTFGNLIHAGIEAWWTTWRDLPGGTELPAALALMDASAAMAIDAYPDSDPLLKLQARTLMLGYRQLWGDLGDWQVLAIERNFSGPLINPDTMHPSRTWLLAGKLDLILHHLPTGQVHLSEHKTTTDSFTDDSDHYWLRLAMDSQLTQYVIGAEILGWRITHITYDVIRRPKVQPKKATPEAQRKYCKTGPRQGQLHAGQRYEDETLGEYQVRLAGLVASEASHYYRRRTFARLDSEVQAGLADAWDEGKEMREAERTGRHPRNPDACLRYGTCPYYECCSLGVDPSTSTRFKRLDNVHPELDLEEIQ